MTKLEKFALSTATGVLIYGILYTFNFVASIITSNPLFGFFILLLLSVFVVNLFILFDSYR